MARAFAQIAFTPNVQAVQAEMGSRQAYRPAETGEMEVPELGLGEIEFIMQRDSFYQGTVGENGWPYVQHRGGPSGFLKVLDNRTIGYADFSGNRQYISVGNLRGDNRISLFLMDYPQQRRLKIWGRAHIVDDVNAPDLIARLESPHYRARVERGVVIRIEAFDWNCPKYITPRYTEAEIMKMLPTVRQDISNHGSANNDAIGKGELSMVVTGIRQLTPKIRVYEFRSAVNDRLPAVEAGTHLNVPVRLPDGSLVTRQYSLTSTEQPYAYEIASSA